MFSVLIEGYQFSDMEPLFDDVMKIVNTSPGTLQRKSSARRIFDKMVGNLETLIEQMGDLEPD